MLDQPLIPFEVVSILAKHDYIQSACDLTCTYQEALRCSRKLRAGGGLCIDLNIMWDYTQSRLQTEVLREARTMTFEIEYDSGTNLSTNMLQHV